MAELQKIVFVWNADFSVAGGVRALKEMLSGQGHSCTLCEIAYHRVKQTDGWKDYKQTLRDRLNVQIEEPCKNQIDVEQYEAADGDFPAVLAHIDGRITKLLGSAEIDRCDGKFEPFREQLDAALAELGK